MARRISHVIGFDDAPFPRNYRGDVLLVGAVYAGPRLEGVLSDKVRRDGINATRTIVRLVSKSHYREHLLLAPVVFDRNGGTHLDHVGGTANLARLLGGELPIGLHPDEIEIYRHAPLQAKMFGLEVEQLITRPVEDAMGGLPRLTQLRSVSRYGISAVTVVFDDGTAREVKIDEKVLVSVR